MTYAHPDRRVAKLESRVGDIETCHSESIYKLTRSAVKSDVIEDRLIDGMNALGRGMGLMMEHMGPAPIDLPIIAYPREAEIDAELEDEY